MIPAACHHRWTIIPKDVMRLAVRGGLPDPVWYVGRTTAPYCRDCGEKMPGGVAAWNVQQARYRRRAAMWDDLFWGALIVVFAVGLVLMAAYG